MSAASTAARARASQIPYLVRWSDASGQLTIECLAEVLMDAIAATGTGVLLQGVYMDGEARTWMVLLSQPLGTRASDPPARQAAADGSDSGIIGLLVKDGQRDSAFAELAARGLELPSVLLLITITDQVAAVSLVEPHADRLVHLFDFPSRVEQLISINFAPFEAVAPAGKHLAAMESPVDFRSASPESVGVVPFAADAGLRSRDSKRPRALLLWALLGSATAGGAAAGLFLWRTAPQPVATSYPAAPAPERSAQKSLGLQITRRGAKLQIGWDRDLRNIREAASGVLKITDADQRFAIPLSKSDLATGQILYPSVSKSLRFELAIETPAGTETETVQLIVAPVTPERIPEQLVRSVSRPPTTAEEGAAAADTSTASAPAMQVSSLPVVQTRQPVLPSPSLVEPPAISANIAPAAAVPAARVVVPGPPPSHPAPNLPANNRPTPPNRVAQPAAAVLFEAAVPIRQPQPQVPNILRQAILRPVSIEVSVGIDAAGKVTSAQSPAYTGVAGHLTQLAKDAVRSWTFQPARRNGQPIASELVIRFNFDKPRRP